MTALTAPPALAVFGARPTFAEPLHVGRPNLGDRSRLLERIADMHDRRWLSNHGPFCVEFEHRLAAHLGVKHCVAMCNATVALEITARALGLTGEVIVPSYTFIATAHALQWQEITPVFCDVAPGTHNIDPDQIERHITPRTTGIIGVHVWGEPCDVDALAEIARRRRLTLLFDAAHAFGCGYKGRPVGNLGHPEVFSFHATKFLNTGEGGAVVTNDDDLAARIRLMQNFGFRNYDDVCYIGTNGKMSEMAAAMGLTNLESVDEFVAINRRNYHLYRRRLADTPGVSVFRYDEPERRNYQYVVLEIDRKRTGISRDLLVKVLHAENVLARRYFYPGCHRMEPYRSYFPNVGMLLPNTEEMACRVLVLPTGTQVSPPDIETICELIRTAIRHGPELTSRLERLPAVGPVPAGAQR
jgi:dTDP-4-amino-4,6-dideoxygalactose transaminase